jgi:hypothetical protein
MCENVRDCVFVCVCVCVCRVFLGCAGVLTGGKRCERKKQLHLVLFNF